MTPIAILALLGLALFIPVFMDDGDEPETPEEPVEPVNPVDPVTPVEPVTPVDTVDPVVPPVLDGTASADTLVAQSGQEVNGNSGADTITAGADVTGATIDGGRDDDSITVAGTNNTADGYRGNDFFDINGSGNTANGGDGSDTFSVDALNATVNGGQGNDDIDIEENSTGVLANGGQGDDSIGGKGQDITLNGNAGDDLIGYSASSGSAAGGGGDDTIVAFASGQGLSGSVFGDGGNDSLAVDNTDDPRGPVLLDGGLGNDDLTSFNVVNEVIHADTLTGGEGEDTFNIFSTVSDSETSSTDEDFVTITDFNRDEDLIQLTISTNISDTFVFDGLEFVEAPDGSYTDIISTFTATSEGVADTISTVRVLGATDLGPDDIFFDSGNNPTEGNDILEARDTDADVVAGLGGDDVIVHDARDDGRDLTLSGGEGNDTLIAEELEISINTTLDGGAGDDVLRTNIGVVGSFETFITGEGSDTIEISLRDGGPNAIADVGLFGEVTDFTPGEDAIVLDTAFLLENTAGGFAEGFTQTLTLTEAADGAFTDVGINVIANANNNAFTGTIRILGATGLTEADLGFALSDPS